MVHIGIDLHKRYSYVVAISDKGTVINQKTMPHSRQNWSSYIKAFYEPAQAVVESTVNWYFLADWLNPLVHKLVLANSFKTKAIAGAKIKTD